MYTDRFQSTVPPKQKGKRRREPEKPLSGLDVDALLRGEKRQRIDPDNAIPEFKQALAQTVELTAIREVSKQMSDIIESIIKNSPGALHYPKALECLGVLRDELVDLEEPEIFNDFLRQLKPKILGGHLGGERTDVWYRLRVKKLGLIDSDNVENSSVTPEQAKEVSTDCTIYHDTLADSYLVLFWKMNV
jgi:ATP-dependent DNA helicase 2 subunit 2